MAQTTPVNKEPTPGLLHLTDSVDYETLAGFHRLGLGYGLLLGLALALGFWLPKVIVLARLPLWFPYGGAILSSLAVIGLCCLTGWLTSHLRRAIFVVISWLVTAVLICVSLGTLPPVGQNWAIWLADGRFANLAIYHAPAQLVWWSYVIAGFFLVVALALLAILQNFNLGRVYLETSNGRRLNLRAGLMLLGPVLVAGTVGALFPDLSGAGPRDALLYTQQGIERVRSYDGDLFQLSNETGFNYNALASVADQLDGPYTLLINEVDEAWSTAIVTAHFDSGAWVNCRVNINQRRATYFSFCFDAAIPFTDGLNHLLTNSVPADSCRRCEVTAAPQWQRWLQARRDLFAGDPAWQRVAQYGRFILMQATTDSGTSITCRLEGAEVVSLVSCAENGEPPE